jgi:hypothetical protein
MAKSENSKDNRNSKSFWNEKSHKEISHKVRSEIVFEEIEQFKKLTEGHMKLLEAIGNL